MEATTTSLALRGGTIYLLRSPSGKAYVGQTRFSAGRRLEEHAQRAHSHCRAVSAALQKYGKGRFETAVLASGVPVSYLNLFEYLYVGLCGTLAPAGYNLVAGGGVIRHASLETSAKRSAAMRAFYARPDQKERTSEIRKEASRRPEVRAVRSRSMRGLRNRPDAMDRRIAALRRAWDSPEVRKKRSEDRKAAWADPVYREKQRAAWARRKERRAAA